MTRLRTVAVAFVLAAIGLAVLQIAVRIGWMTPKDTTPWIVLGLFGLIAGIQTISGRKPRDPPRLVDRRGMLERVE